MFFGSMVIEGLVALCWAAVAMAFFNGQPQLAVIYGATPSVAVHQIAQTLVGPVGLILAIIGVVVCPITTGDTSLRSSRITLADELNLNHEKLISRLKTTLPLFLIGFAWTQLIVATIILYAASVYLIKKEKPYIIGLIPALFCTSIAIAYILQAPEGLGISSMIANAVSVIATAVIAVLFLKKYR